MNKEKRFLREKDCTIVIFICTALFGIYYVCMAQKGFNTIDESFYYTIAHRLLLGDGLIGDEWHVSQLSSVLQFIPFSLIYKITGSTEGIILSMRYCYILCRCSMILIIYFFVREEDTLAALLASVFYGAFVPIYVEALDYYTLSIGLLVIFCLLFFVNKKKNKIKYAVCGFIFALAVLAEPLIAVLYFGYTVALLCFCIKNKSLHWQSQKIGFLFDTKIWFFLTSGIFIAAVLFFFFLFSKTSFSEFINTIPELFTDTEYIFYGKDQNVFQFGFIYYALKIYCTPIASAGVLLTIFCFIAKKVIMRNRLIVFYTGICLAFFIQFFFLYKTFFVDELTMLFWPLFFQILGGFCYALSQNKKWHLFAVWLIGMLFSTIMDISSSPKEGNFVGFGSMVSNTVSAVFIVELLRELFDEKFSTIKHIKKSSLSAVPFLQKHRKGLNRLLPFFSILLAFILCVNLASVLFEQYRFDCIEDYYCETKQPLDTELTSGPMKGIKTTADVARKYNLYLEDLQQIKENNPASVYVADLQSWMYLYLDKPYGIYSTWFVGADSETRTSRYWELNPDKIPEIIYIPFYDCYEWSENDKNVQRQLAFLTGRFNCTVSEGKAGYILYID